MQNPIPARSHICMIMFMVALITAVCSLGAYASSVPAATGQIDSDTGVNLRSSASTE